MSADIQWLVAPVSCVVDPLNLLGQSCLGRSKGAILIEGRIGSCEFFGSLIEVLTIRASRRTVSSAAVSSQVTWLPAADRRHGSALFGQPNPSLLG